MSNVGTTGKAHSEEEGSMMSSLSNKSTARCILRWISGLQGYGFFLTGSAPWNSSFSSILCSMSPVLPRFPGLANLVVTLVERLDTLVNRRTDSKLLPKIVS
ncbi:uncharacterized protein LOC119770199 [Culex quinquefasciatus]|uniref:uncharacterized protein LOC119770199 n=1 Tax=Culex quinquefasciatus TaxID=7176 RepID=UPI0018E3D370|nr:uncharacterized protein LOC119767455 isoform X2 [Culex quinquefasciatus]XP_038120575.1 uncharacterized protein LOC119770199 [Culex quinquefasciatus]